MGSSIVGTVTPLMSTIPTDPRHRELYDLAVRIGLSWREVRRGAATAGLRDYLYGSDRGSIEQGQMDTLDLLALHPAWRMSELAEALRVEPSTATRAVQRLVNAGLAERTPSPEDGRVVQVEITRQGRDVYEAVAARRSELLTFIMKQYGRDELPVFADMLERFVVSIDAFVEDHQSEL